MDMCPTKVSFNYLSITSEKNILQTTNWLQSNLNRHHTHTQHYTCKTMVFALYYSNGRLLQWAYIHVRMHVLHRHTTYITTHTHTIHKWSVPSFIICNVLAVQLVSMHTQHTSTLLVTSQQQFIIFTQS